MEPLSFGCIPALSLDTAHSDLGEHLVAVYSGWKSLDNYDTYASVFVVLFNGFMSLTSYFDVVMNTRLPRWSLHLNVLGEFESFRDPESYADGSVATGRDTQAGEVKG